MGLVFVSIQSMYFLRGIIPFTILLTVLIFFGLFSFLLLGLMTIFSVVFKLFFFLFVCVYIVDIWFAITLKFWYRSLYIQNCFKSLVCKLQGHLKCTAFVHSSQFLILVTDLCVNDFLFLLYVWRYWCALSLIIIFGPCCGLFFST